MTVKKALFTYVFLKGHIFSVSLDEFWWPASLPPPFLYFLITMTCYHTPWHTFIVGQLCLVHCCHLSHFFSLQLMQFSSRAYSIVLNTVQADGLFCSANFYSHFSPNGPSTATVCSLHPIFTGFIMLLAIPNWISVTFVPCNCGVFLFRIFLAVKLSRGGRRFSISLLQQLTIHLQYWFIVWYPSLLVTTIINDLSFSNDCYVRDLAM